MIVSELIYIWQEVKKQHGDIEVVKNEQDEELWACAGYMSCTGQCYSAHSIQTNPKDYPESKEFDLKKDICFIV